MMKPLVAALLLLAAVQDASPAKKRGGGFLGLTFRELDSGGLKLERVLAGSGADKAGFKAGDVLVAINGGRIANGDAFLKRLWMARDKKTSITVKREGRDVEIPAGLAQLDAAPAIGDKAPPFALKTPDGRTEIKLAGLLGKKPVLLVFGSWT